MTPVEAVKRRARLVRVHHLHTEGTGFEVAAVDAKDEAIHHVKLTLEEVD